jgi:hypothetical protein
MASTYTPLGVELQATGENAGTWGTKTNTNLQILEQISGGFIAKSIAGGAQTTALAVSDGSTGAELAHRMIDFTGTITGNQIVTIPLDVQTFYILRNSTSGAYTVQFKYASGSGSTFTFTATQKTTKIVFATANDSTNPDIIEVQTGGDVVDDTSPQLGGNLDTNSFMIDFDDAHGIRDEKATGNIEIMGATNPGSIQLNCEANSHGIKLTGPAHSAGQSYELKFPTGNVTADRFLKVDSVSGSGATGVGQLSFAEVSGGTSWQAVKTSTFTAVAGEGYFIDTSSGAIEMDLPAGNIGDEVSFIDYAGTFDTNALTIDQNGSEKIAGSTDPLTVSTERAANTLVYVDSTQGWLLKNN